ncbi:E3 ubiquitin-protein ligase Topors isoform X2 [Xenopus laevis]|uniref:E3 ubiquitin-protein ligase Topors n=2 Tax=Xenopus laevis TaxID=8355 RepID=A0A974DTM5_XENLA|nr:E3 ubiquitin-protein ligase Topors isoform X2 [Xenopus laevis]OCT97753.1 hypothetical protein XELAEV_18009981mg [Xenopus laevis]
MREKRMKRRRVGGRQEAADAMMSSSSNSYSLDGSFSPKAGTSKLQSYRTSTDASPDSKCPICLDRFDNVSHLDQCLHKFCFRCIQEWAKNKAECPLCKQPFYSIFHSVKAEDDFKEYVLRPTVNGSFASPDGHRFRYRTTITRDHHVPIRPLRSSNTQRTFSPPDNGILFEGFSNQSFHQRGEEIHQMIRRLASRRQASAEGRSMRQIQEQELINFRRALYRSGIRVRNIQDGGRYRDISAEFFRRNPACHHRLVPWLKRELTVLFGSHGSLVNIVQHIIMSNVARYDMESQAFIEDLRPFLLHRTDHFIHEFVNFARCPYNIEAYDQHSNYDCPAPSYEEESRSESSVITISPDEADTRDPDIASAAIGVGQTSWDDETPGPSYSTLEQASATASTTLDISESSDDEPPSITQISQDLSNSETTDILQDQSLPADDCVIVGYVKPLAERTPELVELSSDSESSLCEIKTEDTKKPLLKPFILSASSELSRSSSSLYTPAKEKRLRKTNHKGKTVSSKHCHSRKKEKGKHLLDISTGKYKGDLHNSYALSRWRDRSRSSDCYSRSSRNKSHNNRRRHCSRNSPRSLEKSRHKRRRERKRSRSRDRSLSWRSRTVSLTSESSREICESSSRSRNLSRGRSQSHDRNNDFSTNNYRNSYQWEYTYYSRNRNRDGYEQSYRRRTCGRGHYSRPSASPEYKIQSYSEKKDTRRARGYITSKQYRRDRYRSRSRSSSPMNTSGTEHTRSDKPSGKRKYKTHHLEKHKRERNNRESSSAKGKEGGLQTVKASLGNHTGHFKNDLMGSSSEPKQKLKKKTRSPSVEIVYEGKAAEGAKHHKKKKKKKHKKKRRREQTSSPAASPIIITIDSGSDTPMVEDLPSNDHNSLVPENKTNVESINFLHSQPPATSASASTTEVLSGERADSDFKASVSNRHLDAATGILDGLHFDDSSDEQNLLPVESPPYVQDLCEDEPSAAESSLPEPNPVLDNVPPTSTSEISELHKSFTENICEFDLLHNVT